MSDKLKPVLVVPPKSISRDDIEKVEAQGGFLVVECADPDAARFLFPPPEADLDQQAQAALALMRMVLSSQAHTFTRGDLTRWFVDVLLNAPQPKPIKPIKAERRTSLRHA
jgi:hypothetical protein